MEEMNSFSAYKFLPEVNQRFPTFHSAINTLRRIRKPPKACVDSDHVNTTSLALAAQNWVPLIGPWVKLFLNFAEEQSLSSPYPLLFDKVSYVIPTLLSYSAQCSDATKETEIVDLLQMAPYLLRSTTKIWLRTLSELHWSWGHWAFLLAFLCGVNHSHTIAFAHEVLARNPGELKDITGSAIRLVYALNGHIRAKRHDAKDLQALGAHLRLLATLLYCGDRSPLHPLLITSGGVKAVVTLHNTLVSQHIFASESFPALLAIIQITSDGVLGIMDALELGLLISIFKTGELYAPELPEFQSHDTFLNVVRRRHHEILQNISLYLIYPDVLRRFSKGMRRIIDGGLDEKLEDNRDPFWRCWEQCKEQVAVLELLKERMKDPIDLGSLVCSSFQCPLKEVTSCECSHACAKSHSRAYHRTVCGDRALALKAGKPCISSRDRAFFLNWVTFYICEHGRSILEALAGFIPPPWEPSTAGNENEYIMLLQEVAHQRGVVVLDFCNLQNLGLRSLECLSVRHIDDVVRDPRLRSDPDFIKSLRDDHLWLDETKMQVLAFFPDTTEGGERVFPLSEVYKLPQLGDTDSEDDSLNSLEEDLEGDLPQ
uniref:MYND-type domain-containing protein n=1 Tax=Moniliophthora roreri TaxID=221103 RepID=A0A0W0G311_MONRR